MLFDAYIAVDWSASSRPTRVAPRKDAIWMGELLASDPTRVNACYFRTRHCCIRHVRAMLADLVAAGRRVFVGFDFAYGYPVGFADGLLRRQGVVPWRWTWDVLSREILDGPDNRNNRYAVAAALNALFGDFDPGPFWGCPPAAATAALSMRSKGIIEFPYGGPDGLARFRETERHLPGVQSVWKLAGAGSVGSQALVGIPAVARLRDDPELASVSRVWPFETGFSSEPSPRSGPFVLHAEIWPGVVNDRLDSKILIRDEAQVCAYVAWLYEMDASGALGALFAPGGIERIADCVSEEGWILGAISASA